MVFRIIRSMVEGTHLAVYASIKPGCYHRFSFDAQARTLVSNTISIIEHLYKLSEYGEKVRRGETALSHNYVSQTIARALRDAYRTCGYVHPSLLIPQLMLSFALSHSNVDSVLQKPVVFKKSLDLVLETDKWSDIRLIIDALKSVYRNDMYDHLVSTGFTQLGGVMGNYRLRDLFRTLGSRWVGFNILDTIEFRLVENVAKFVKYVKEYRNIENAIIAIYLDLIRNRVPKELETLVEKAYIHGLMSTREGARTLYELDQSLKKNNVSFNEYIEYLSNIVSIAIYEGTSIT
ncbi:MAG: hypothetical protein QXO78_05555 [Desulfurococcaceae archaeon]